MLFGLRDPSTVAYRLLGGARPWCQNVSLQRAHTDGCSLIYLPSVSMSPKWVMAAPKLPRRLYKPVNKSNPGS